MTQPLKICHRCGKHGNAITAQELAGKKGDFALAAALPHPHALVCEFCGWKVRL